ncbi:hypothetical protein VTJ04DRAFT_5852 [Mycothermus thermophilus]|uniref:uncharacterized protein n=1 Tax=Humicola insolens TaxID=85995 RepID=UPI0037433CCD
MSTPEPPSRSSAPPDPSRPWLQQTHRDGSPSLPPSSSTSSSPSSATSVAQFPSSQPSLQPKPGSNGRDPTLTEAIATIKPSDFLTFHQAPCVRPGLLTGIGFGATVGALRWIMGLPIPRAANWAVGTGLAAAAGRYEYCQYQRRQEKAKVKRVVQVFAEKQAKERREKEERERLERERKEKEEAERRKRWWKFW